MEYLVPCVYLFGGLTLLVMFCLSKLGDPVKAYCHELELCVHWAFMLAIAFVYFYVASTGAAAH